MSRISRRGRCVLLYNLSLSCANGLRYPFPDRSYLGLVHNLCRHPVQVMGLRSSTRTMMLRTLLSNCLLQNQRLSLCSAPPPLASSVHNALFVVQTLRCSISHAEIAMRLPAM